MGFLGCLTFSATAGGDRFGGASGERVRSRSFVAGSDFLEVSGEGERSLRFLPVGDRASGFSSGGGVSNRRFFGGDFERDLATGSGAGGGAAGLRSRRNLEVFFRKSFAVLGEDPPSDDDEVDCRRSLDGDLGFISTGFPSRMSRYRSGSRCAGE